MATCYSNFELGPPASTSHCATAPPKDYSTPLHVDCSVEYELPNQAKPPEGAKSEPLLMIHPCYYRRAESQRRSPFINNLPTPRGVVTPSRRSQASQVRLVPQQQRQQQQQPYQVRYLEATNQQTAWNQQLLEPPPMYTKPAGGKQGKRDPLLCGGGDFSSGSDSGVSAGHWTDSDRSPLAPEQRDCHNNNLPGGGTDSGITTPISLVDDKTLLSELLAATCGSEVNNNSCNKDAADQHQGAATGCEQCHHSSVSADPPQNKQPDIAVAAVAAGCTTCRPDFLPPHTSQPPYQHILQQPWAGMTGVSAAQYQQPALATMPTGGSKQRGGGALRAAEPGPEHAASSLHHVHARRAVPWARTTSTSSVKRNRNCHAQETPAALPSTNSWAVQPQYLHNVTPGDTASRPGWSTQQQQQQGNTKDNCGHVCSACCHATAVPAAPNTQQQQHQPQWGSYYGVTGQCRGASEDGSRILWNNENMLRLFQV